MRVIRVQGVEVEAQIAFGALQRIGRPLAKFASDIPENQRAALRVAVGLDEGPPPELPLVGLGALSLLARAGDDQPTVCIIDDAHHLDQESLLALGFVARRLSAESVVLLFASRPGDVVASSLASVPRLELGGLDAASASALLRQKVRGNLDPTVVLEYVTYTGGNPLALREIASERTAEELTASAIGHSPIPIGRHLEQLYTQRIETLPEPTRAWLLLAAAESTGDSAAVQAAARARGIPAHASSPAEQIDFVTVVHGSIRFRHPLIRSAIYLSAAERDRLSAHHALSAYARDNDRPDLAAWHAAAATPGPDQAVSDQVADAAGIAGSRGGMLSRAHLLGRAAELTPDPALRSERYIAAAEACLSAGAATLALQMLSNADSDRLDDVGIGRTLIVEAMCGLFLSESVALRGGMAKLIHAADLMEQSAPDLAQHALLLAMNSATGQEDRATGANVLDLAKKMRDVSSGDHTTAAVLEAVSSFILDPYPVAVPHLRRAVAALDALDDARVIEFTFAVTVPTIALWDWNAASRLLGRVVRIGRETGALRAVDSALWILSAVEMTRGDPALASLYLEQAAELRRALGSLDELAVNAALLAWQGTPSSLVEQVSYALNEAGWGGIARMATGAIATQEIAAGEYAPAFERLTPIVRHPFLQATFHQIPEFVEAAVRSGNRPAALEAAKALDMYAVSSESPVARGFMERSHALLAEADQAEALFRASIRSFHGVGHRGDSARSRLLYGEWLRRVRRRSDARIELEGALRAFSIAGATAFAERARRELRATGATVVDRPKVNPTLTPQEDEVARLAASGATNAEIGATLFISANTVDYHLRKVFRKLEITSRRQLMDYLRDLTL